MGTSKRCIFWEVEELDEWMEMVDKEITMVRSNNEGLAVKEKETVSIGHFKSKRGGKEIVSSLKTKKVGYSDLMLAKINECNGDERKLTVHSPFNISGTNPEKATMRSYWTCPHKNLLSVHCPWLLFRLGKRLRFEVSEHDCKLCSIDVEKISIMPSSSGCKPSTSSHPPEFEVSNNFVFPSVSARLAFEFHNKLQKNFSFMLSDWYKSLPARVGYGQELRTMAAESFQFGVNINNMIVNAGNEMIRKLQEERESVNIVHDIQRSEHRTDQSIQKKVIPNQAERFQPRKAPDTTIGDFDALPLVIQATIHSLESCDDDESVVKTITSDDDESVVNLKNVLKENIDHAPLDHQAAVQNMEIVGDNSDVELIDINKNAEAIIEENVTENERKLQKQINETIKEETNHQEKSSKKRPADVVEQKFVKEKRTAKKPKMYLP